jgi:hypothetical protein
MKKIFQTPLKTVLFCGLSIATTAVLAAQAVEHLAAKLSIEPQDRRIFSHITVTQPQAKAGKITVVWTAPEHSYCLNSSYPLDYNYTHYRTRAFRTVIHTDAKGRTHVCAGTWKVQVLDENKNVLTSREYVVKSPTTDANTKPNGINKSIV